VPYDWICFVTLTSFTFVLKVKKLKIKIKNLPIAFSDFPSTMIESYASCSSYSLFKTKTSPLKIILLNKIKSKRRKQLHEDPISVCFLKMQIAFLFLFFLSKRIKQNSILLRGCTVGAMRMSTVDNRPRFHCLQGRTCILFSLCDILHLAFAIVCSSTSCISSKPFIVHVYADGAGPPLCPKGPSSSTRQRIMHSNLSSLQSKAVKITAYSVC